VAIVGKRLRKGPIPLRNGGNLSVRGGVQSVTEQRKLRGKMRERGLQKFSTLSGPGKKDLHMGGR